MMRNFLSVLFLLVAVVFSVQAQKSDESKADARAKIITKYINSKVVAQGGEEVTAEQTGKIKDAYTQYYEDRSSYKKRKKEFIANYKAWRKAVSQPVSPEEKAKLEEQKKEIAAGKKFLDKEKDEMPVRRDKAIKEALDGNQTAAFEEMRAEQSKKDDDDADKK